MQFTGNKMKKLKEWMMQKTESANWEILLAFFLILTVSYIMGAVFGFK